MLVFQEPKAPFVILLLHFSLYSVVDSELKGNKCK